MKKLTQEELDCYLDKIDGIHRYNPNFIPADFSNMDLSGLVFSNKVLRKNNFTNTKLTGTVFNGCVFRDTKLSKKQLLEARFVKFNWLEPKAGLEPKAVWWFGIAEHMTDRIDKEWQDHPSDTLMNIDDFMEWYES